MSAKLIWITPDAQNIISYCARVSNPKNQENYDTAPKLLKYCASHGHWSVFEQASMGIEIETTRAISAQMLRHKSMQFQEFCLSGDTDIYFAIPCKIKEGKYKPTRKYKLKELYEKWNFGAKPIIGRTTKEEIRMPMKERIKNMFIKCYDEEEKKLTTTTIKDIFYTGKKEIYKITLSDGKEIKTTKEHKFLTRDGFLSLEEAVGLEIKNDKILMTKKPDIATNGILNYQDKSWLEEKKKESLFAGGGIKYITEKYGFNYNTIRKWLKRHNLTYSKTENAIIIGDVWNKGKFGYKTKPHTEEARLKMRESARKGPDSNLWRGGGSKGDIRKTFDTVRALTYKREKNFKCERCESSEKLNIHHKIPVSVDPSKINDIDNWELLCRNCHIEHHKKEDYTGWHAMARKAKKENCYIPKWTTIKHIEYLGEEDTYDLEVNHTSHNYVANGIIVHNSQRYAETSDFTLPKFRNQDNKNRQNSLDNVDEKLQEDFQNRSLDLIKKSFELYEEMISKGIAKESARFILPLCTNTRLYMTGSIRSWIHYLQARTAEDTQLEHRLIALKIKDILLEQLPVLKEILP